MTSKELQQVQIGLLFKEEYPDPFSLFIDSLKDTYGSNQVEDKGIPDELPANLPRASLNFQNPKTIVNFSKTRIDVFLERMEEVIPRIKEVFEFATLNSDGNKKKVVIDRVGLVQTFFIMESDVPKMKNRLLKEGVTSDIPSSELDLRINQPQKINFNNSQLLVNDIETLKTVKIFSEKDSTEQSVFLDIRDVNNLNSAFKDGLDIESLLKLIEVFSDQIKNPLIKDYEG